MTRFFFDENSPQGLGAWYQTIEKGFAKNLPEEASAMHIEVLRELVDADVNFPCHGLSEGSNM